MARLLSKLGSHTLCHTFRISVVLKHTVLSAYSKDRIIKRRVFILHCLCDILRRDELHSNLHTSRINSIRCIEEDGCKSRGARDRLYRNKVEVSVDAINGSDNLFANRTISKLLRSLIDFLVTEDERFRRNLDLLHRIFVKVHVESQRILEERAIGNNKSRRIIDRLHVNNHGSLCTNSIMICRFEENIGQRVIAMEVQCRLIGKRTEVTELSQLAILGRINENNDEIVTIRIASLLPDGLFSVNNKGFIFISLIFEIHRYRRTAQILDGNDKADLDQIRLRIRRGDGNNEGRIFLDVRRNKSQRIVQSHLIQGSQVFHQRGGCFKNKQELVVILVSKQLLKRNLQCIRFRHRIQDHGSSIVWSKHLRGVVFLRRRIVRAARITRANRPRRTRTGINNGNLNLGGQRHLTLNCNYDHIDSGIFIFFNVNRGKHKSIFHRRRPSRLNLRQQSRWRHNGANRHRVAFTGGKDLRKDNL